MTSVAGPPQAPFLGLRFFDEEQSHLFFGRDAQVNDVLEKLRRSRLVTVIGGSGSGKSSLVRAGVLRGLKAGVLAAAGPRWRIAKMRPGSNPIASLTRELEKALSTSGLEVTLRRGPLGLVQAIAECGLPPGENVLIVADQFEEVFRYQREAHDLEQAKEQTAAFVKLLLEAAGQRELPIYVLITMRSDYLGSCAQFRDLPERINDGLYLVPRMRRDDLDRAIAGPVAVEDAEISPRLVQKLLNDTGDDPDQLPLLQHALLRAWHAWNHAARPIDLEDLDAVGGMADSLSRHADEVFAVLSAEQQRIARVVFQQLSERDAEGREIRRPAAIEAIAAVAGVSAQAVDDVAAPFAAPDVALLYRNEDGHLDITHESLIRKWSRMQGTKQGGAGSAGWMQEEVDARDQFQLLMERAEKKDTLMGRALDDATRWRALGLNAGWARRYTAGPAADTTFPEVVRFIDESRGAAVARKRLFRGLAIASFAAVAIFLIVIIQFWRSAERQRAAAEDSTRRAQAALAQATVQDAVRLFTEGHPDFALAHLAHALRLAPDELAARSWISQLIADGRWWPIGRLEHEKNLEMAAFSTDGRRIVTGMNGGAKVWDAVTGDLVGTVELNHYRYVQAPDFSADASLLILRYGNGTAQLWNTEGTGRPAGPAWPLSESDQRIYAFSRDGRRLVVGSNDTGGRIAQVVNAVDGTAVGAQLSVESGLRTATFSPDGSHFITVVYGGTAQVWNTTTGLAVGAPLPRGHSVNSVAFSPDGRRFVTASEDKTARVWDAATGEPVSTALQHTGPVKRAVFSADGQRVVTASDDMTARVWDVASGQLIGAPLQHEKAVSSAVFTLDGRRIVTVSDDDTVRLWEVGWSQPMAALRQPGKLDSSSFSTDGRRLVTASGSTALVWDMAAGQPVGSPLQAKSAVNDAVFSPDGRRVMIPTFDKTPFVWDTSTGESVGMPLQHDAAVRTTAFTADGRRILTTSDDGKARLWDAETGFPSPPPLQQGVFLAVLSPDGRLIVTTSEKDGMVRVWNSVTGQPVGVPFKTAGATVSVIFSPDGRRLVTELLESTLQSTLQVWDVVTGGKSGPALTGQRVYRMPFSPDGKRLVTTSNGRTAQVWDVATGQPLQAPLDAGTGNVLVAMFSPDGKSVLVVKDNKTARVWDAATGATVGAPLQHDEGVFSASFSPDGRRIVTGSFDQTARVWETATGHPLGPPRLHHDAVRAVAFTNDGQRVVTVAGDSTARVWDVLLGTGSADEVALLADLAEVVGGYYRTDLGSLVALNDPERLQRVRRLAGPEAKKFVRLDVLLRRFKN